MRSKHWAASVRVIRRAGEALARFGKIPPYILPAPTKVVLTGISLIQDGTLIPDIGISLLRAASGFAIGGAIGFALGVAVGFSRTAGLLLDRTVLMLRAVPSWRCCRWSSSGWASGRATTAD
jgi:sulfonate transport system permease protein